MIRYQPRVAVAMPFYQWMPAEAAITLGKLLVQNVGNPVVAFMHDQFPLLGMARDNLVRGILKSDMAATHVLFLDSDMVVPADAPTRLLAHDKPIVSALYFERSYPFRPAYRFVDGQDPPSEAASPGAAPFAVDLIGMGCVLISLSVFRKLDPPWFVMEKVGEDYHFCRRAREAGFEILVDPAIECAHMGTVGITRANAGLLRGAAHA